MTTVKYFHSNTSSAPSLNFTAGAYISLLDGCLVNGYGSVTATSLAVASNVATMTINAGHTFEQDCIVLVEGATPSGLNGEKRVISTTGTTITFDATGISDQTATGTITAKWAPLGWAKAFSGTNLAAYRPSDVASNRLYLRVDATSATEARVIGYEAMSDINTGTGPFPTTAQVSNGLYWAEGSATAGPRGWTIVGNSKCFYLCVYAAANSSTNAITGILHGFGDFFSTKSGDVYNTFIQGQTASNNSGTVAVATDLSYGTAGTAGVGVYVPRSYTQAGTSVACTHVVEAYQATAGTSGAVANFIYPNTPDNSLILSRKLIGEASNTYLRGVFPGLLHVAQNAHAFFSWRDKIDGQGTYLNRKLMAVKCGSPQGTASQGVVFFDITGPWS